MFLYYILYYILYQQDVCIYTYRMYISWVYRNIFHIYRNILLSNIIIRIISHYFYQFYQIGICIFLVFIKKKEHHKYNLGLILQVQNKFGTTRNIDFIQVKCMWWYHLLILIKKYHNNYGIFGINRTSSINLLSSIIAPTNTP